MDTLLTLDSIACRYGDNPVFHDLSFKVERGQIACLLGPSGCGKTTALRAIAGFEPVHSGRITLDGQVLSEPGRTLAPEKRHIGMVFQDYALFPHLSIADNIAFGLHQLDKPARRARTTEMLDLIRMPASRDAYPHQLSGGQQQRVALARALAPNPRLLLLDEPFSNLDTELRRQLSLEVRDILKSNGTTAVLVTHDQNEAFNVADQIGVMDAGALLQWGTAREVYHHPASPKVAAFVSQGQLVSGVLGTSGIDTVFGPVALEQAPADIPPGSPVNLLLRPWNIVIDPEGPCRARITGQQFNGAFTQTTLELVDGGLVLLSQDAALASLAPQTEVGIGIHPLHLRVFARPG